MRKLFIYFILIILVCSGTVVFSDDIIVVDGEVQAEGINTVVPYADSDKEKIPGTTPRPSDDAFLLQTVDGDAVAVSNEIYYDFLELDPQIFLYTDEGIENYNSWGKMTHEEHEYVKQKAKEITKDCVTAEEKIRAVAVYVSVNVCYDYDYYIHQSKEYKDIYHSAYDVLINESAVCNGYAITCMALLESLDIPCVFVLSPDHGWNMAYNGERWILFDTTWMSDGILENGVLNKSDRIYEKWYDFSITDANNDANHTITRLDYTIVGNTLSRFPVYSKIIKSFKIPEEVTVIEEHAFRECKTLENVEFPKGLKSIGYAAFYDCILLKSIILPDSVTFIDDFAFGNCEAVKNVVTGNGITSLEHWSFGDSLESIVIGDSIAEISRLKFFECTNLKNVIIGKAVKTIGYAAFYKCNALETIRIPDSVTCLDSLAFQECTSLKKVEIGDGVTEIPLQAFYKCSALEEIVLGSSVESIGYIAFCDTNLKKVYYRGAESDWNNIVFDDYNNKLICADRVYVANTQMKISEETLTVVCRNIPETGCDLYVCCYSGGRLVKIKILKNVLNVDEAFALDKGIDIVKAFMFDADGRLIPIAEESFVQVA